MAREEARLATTQADDFEKEWWDFFRKVQSGKTTDAYSSSEAPRLREALPAAPPLREAAEALALTQSKPSEEFDIQIFHPIRENKIKQSSSTHAEQAKRGIRHSDLSSTSRIKVKQTFPSM